MRDFKSEREYTKATNAVKELLDWAWDEGYDDGFNDAIGDVGERFKKSMKVADQLRSIAYDLEN